MSHVGQLPGINRIPWGSVRDPHPQGTFSAVLTGSASRAGSGRLGFHTLQNSHALARGQGAAPRRQRRRPPRPRDIVHWRRNAAHEDAVGPRATA